MRNLSKIDRYVCIFDYDTHKAISDKMKMSRVNASFRSNQPRPKSNNATDPMYNESIYFKQYIRGMPDNNILMG